MAIDDTHRSIDRCRSHVCHHPPCGQRPTRPAPERSPIDRPSIAHRSHIDRTSIAHRSHIDRPSIAHRSTSRAHPTWPGLKSSLITIGGVTPPVPEPATCWSVDQRVTTKTRRPTTTTTTTTTTRSVPHPLVTGGRRRRRTTDDTVRRRRQRTTRRVHFGIRRPYVYVYGPVRPRDARQRAKAIPFVRGGFDFKPRARRGVGRIDLIAPRVGVFYT